MINRAHDRYLQLLETAFGQEIMPWLQDESVTDIMLNPDGHILVERLGHGKSLTGKTLTTERAETIITLVAAYRNLVVDAANPEIAIEIPFASARFQGWLPPVVTQPTFAIRKRATKVYTLDDYVQRGCLQKAQQKKLIAAMQSRQNIIIVGGTGSGKTTFANALLNEIKDDNARILILEDLPELQVHAEDTVHMCTTPSVDMRQLVKGSLRMRPDRIIIGEVRDSSALDLLKAWNTGHPGGICTLHANSIESTPERLEDLIQEGVANVPRNLILEAVDLIVSIARHKTGEYRIEAIARLVGFEHNAYQFEVL